ncbi:MAG: radical SAM protein [Candidatus Lokiarchaeota archaeon]|nr:radical SAM protein [Candidatus Lokiarchaeota archaeon]
MSNLKYQLSNFFKHKCAVWEFTLKCNSNCIHCGSSAGKSRLDELNTEEALMLVKDLKSCGYDGIALMGGEPFIRDDWYEVAQEIKKNKMKLTIVSNGLEIKEQIQKLKILQIDCVSLSLDGGLPKTHDYIRGVRGAYDKVLGSIKLLQKENIPISVITTVSKINFKELNLIRDWLLNKKIAWQIQIAIPIGRFPRDLVISRKQFYGVAMFIALNLKKYSIKELPLMGAHCFGHFSMILPELGLEPWIGCQAGRSVLGIQSNGNIKGCLILTDDSIEGNVRTTNLSDIINSSFNPKFCQYSHKINLQDYCYTCKMFKKCKGGCLGTRLALNSSNKPYCLRAIEKKLFKNESLPFRWKIDSKISKYKNLYQRVLLKENWR